MSEFKLTEHHLKILKESCDNKSIKINLNILKSIANLYKKYYSDNIDLDLFKKIKDSEKKRKYLTEQLCSSESYTNLETILKKQNEISKTSDIKKKQINKVKPHVSSEKINIVDININIKPADKEYLRELKKKLTNFETDQYNIKKIEEDIKNDNFILKAIEAHIKALEFKYIMYQKLNNIDWNGAKKEQGKKTFTVNINEIIKERMELINLKLKALKYNPVDKNIKEKRENLLNILYDKDNGIATLQGTSRESVKISLLKNMYMFFKIPHFFYKGFNNFLITGSAGSGKTKLASVISYMMNNLGILATNKLVIATKQNLIGEYIGQSAPKTRNLLANILEGVLFIDEAYTLTPCDKGNKDTYSEEAIGELINFIDKFIGCLIVIVAGYKDKMNDCFLTFNEGISRRFPKVIDLIPYSSDDMYKIFETFFNETFDISKIFTKKQREFIKSIIAALNNKQVFNNQAGDMLNLSKVIGEDAILFDDKYNNDMIKYSFMKFCSTKNIAIDF
jgi:hypothetical protein